MKRMLDGIVTQTEWATNAEKRFQIEFHLRIRGE